MFIRRLGLTALALPLGTCIFWIFSSDIHVIQKSLDRNAPLQTGLYENSGSSHGATMAVVKDRVTETKNAETITLTRSTTTVQQELTVKGSQTDGTPYTERPPLASLTDGNGTITGDVEFLLDFSIIGFGKCGTTTLMSWLHQHPKLQCIQEEVWALMQGRPDNLVKRLYKGLPADEPDAKYVRGYKCPSVVTDDRALNAYRRYWPKSKMFIGIRHPVLWFESLYNFRVQQLNYMPEAWKCLGRCMGFHKNTCTEKGNFARDLMRLGKTNDPRAGGPRLMTEFENEIVGHYKRGWFNVTEKRPIQNDIFLFEVAQLKGKENELQIRKDVQDFLGLETPLPSIVHSHPGYTYDAEVQAEKDSRKINICDGLYDDLRTELMRLARNNAQWIRETFIHLPGVYYSATLPNILDSWMHDPCVTRKNKSHGNNSTTASSGTTVSTA